MRGYVGCLESADFIRDIMIRSINENLLPIIQPIRLSPKAITTIGAILKSQLTLKTNDSTQGIFKKVSKSLGDAIGSQQGFSIIPSQNITNYVNDTLVVFCLGSDNLNSRLIEMILCADKHQFTNIIFISSKWDITAITGKNILNLQNIIRLKNTGVLFKFILLSTCGINEICVA